MKGKSTALGRIYAKRIHDGHRTLADCPKKYWDDINASYIDLYGISVPDYVEEIENADNN